VRQQANSVWCLTKPADGPGARRCKFTPWPNHEIAPDQLLGRAKNRCGSCRCRHRLGLAFILPYLQIRIGRQFTTGQDPPPESGGSTKDKDTVFKVPTLGPSWYPLGRSSDLQACIPFCSDSKPGPLTAPQWLITIPANAPTLGRPMIGPKTVQASRQVASQQRHHHDHGRLPDRVMRLAPKHLGVGCEILVAPKGVSTNYCHNWANHSSSGATQFPPQRPPMLDSTKTMPNSGRDAVRHAVPIGRDGKRCTLPAYAHQPTQGQRRLLRRPTASSFHWKHGGIWRDRYAVQEFSSWTTIEFQDEVFR